MVDVEEVNEDKEKPINHTRSLFHQRLQRCTIK